MYVDVTNAFIFPKFVTTARNYYLIKVIFIVKKTYFVFPVLYVYFHICILEV